MLLEALAPKVVMNPSKANHWAVQVGPESCYVIDIRIIVQRNFPKDLEL